MHNVSRIIAIIAGTIFVLASTLAIYAHSQFQNPFDNEDWQFWKFDVFPAVMPFVWVSGIALTVAVIIGMVARARAKSE